jgi:HTH-type transcriptional regulator/antitoxin HipB
VYTSADIAKLVRHTRLGLDITQENLAMAAGTGLSFIKDLEKGKPTCEVEKVLTVLSTLGIQVTLTSPLDEANQKATAERERAHGTRTRCLP